MVSIFERRPQGGVISFFSGCGILDLGFEQAGFSTMLANEVYPPFAEAYQYSRTQMGRIPSHGIVVGGVGDFFRSRHQSVLHKAMHSARANFGAVGFVGGPPCPDFSIAGKQAGASGENGRLTRSYFELIAANRPDFFLFENVKGLVSTQKHRAFFDEMLKLADLNGYEITNRMVNAIEYGAPQDRRRIIVVGFLRDSFPGAAKMMAEQFAWDAAKTHAGALQDIVGWPNTSPVRRDDGGYPMDSEMPCPPHLEAWRELTVQHWFDKNQVDNHPNSHDVFQVRTGLANMQRVEEGDVTRKSFKRLHRWRYSPTAAYGNNEVHLHPWKDRRLSVAEVMAIQSLPSEFVLPPNMSLTDKFKTLGNGVPFKLAHALAGCISESIEKSRSSNESNIASELQSKALV